MGLGSEGRKILWIKWKKVYQLKENGGLGYGHVNKM